MKIAVVGDASEVRGFALAGVEPAICHDEASAVAALRRFEQDPTVAVIVIAPHAANLAAAEVARLMERASVPVPCLLHLENDVAA